jgi:hypothetical protein
MKVEVKKAEAQAKKRLEQENRKAELAQTRARVRLQRKG